MLQQRESISADADMSLSRHLHGYHIPNTESQVETHFKTRPIHYAVIHRLICCAAFLTVVTVAGQAQTTSAEFPAFPRIDDLWQPILPPTSTDGADALDRRIYSQFASDELLLAHEQGSSKVYAFAPHAALISYYDDNINLSHSNKQGDFALAVEPGAAFGLGNFRTREGNFLTLDYTGRFTAYLSNLSADSYEQFATLQAQCVLARWRFNTNFRLFDLTGGNIDSGNAGWHRIYLTTQVASYDLSEKSFLEVQGQNVVRDYQTGPGSVEWQGGGFYNYRMDPKLTFGGGLSGGLLNVENSGGQTYEQILLRALYLPSEKLSFHGEGGVELRRLPNGETRATPVFDLTCDYLPRMGTKLSLAGYSRVLSSSQFGNQDYTAMGVGLSAAQEVGVNWLLTLRGGYENNSYFYTNKSAPSPRKDNFFYVNPSVRFRLSDHAAIELFFNYRQNDSTNASRGFTDSQTGIRTTISY